MARSGRVSRSTPSNSRRPADGSIRRSTHRPTVVLPEPDSPTSPTMVPRLTSKLTPSTARTAPARLGKCFARSRTLSKASASLIARHASSSGCDAPGRPPAAAVLRRSARRARRSAARSCSREAARGRSGPARRSASGGAARRKRRGRGRRSGCRRGGRACRGASDGRRGRSTGAVSTTRPAYMTTT